MLRVTRSHRILNKTTDYLAKLHDSDKRTGLSKILWTGLFVPTGILAHSIAYRYTVDDSPTAKISINRPVNKANRNLQNYQKKYIEMADLEEVIKTGDVQKIEIYGLDNYVNVAILRKKYEDEDERQKSIMDIVGDERVQIIKGCSKLDFLIKLKNIYQDLEREVVRVKPVQVTREFKLDLNHSNIIPDGVKGNLARFLGSVVYLKRTTFSSAHDLIMAGAILFMVAYTNI